MKKIDFVKTSDLAAIVAGLVREGVTFTVSPMNAEGYWSISLTGGY
jgi:hypothetical protein